MKKVLVIIPFEKLYPPINGGMQRCLHVLNQLAKYFDVSAIIHQRSGDFLESVKEFPSLGRVSVYSIHDHKKTKDIFSLLPQRLESALRFRWLARSLKVSADGSFLKYHGLLQCLLKANRYDVIILEKLATLNAVPMIRRYNNKACIIYDAHNIDSNIARDKLENNLITSKIFEGIKNEESALYQKVDGLIACSSRDLEGYQQLNKGLLQAAIIPNGVQLFSSLKDEAAETEVPANIIFCGALNYLPNVEGLLWFYNAIWPLIKTKLPALRLIVIGSGTFLPALTPLQNDPSILFEGSVTDVKEYYNKAGVSIVPLKKGSGTRLKILEAMSLGVPVISTSKGAEGIEYIKDQNIIIADTEDEFADTLINLISKKEERRRLKENARLLIREKYDWDIIGAGLYAFIEKAVRN